MVARTIWVTVFALIALGASPPPAPDSEKRPSDQELDAATTRDRKIDECRSMDLFKLARRAVSGKTVDECSTKARGLREGEYSMCFELAESVAYLPEAALSECFKRAMAAQLDIRLLELKKSDPGQFKKEMQWQKAFNRAAKELCAYTGKASTDCYSGLYRYRAKQAEAILQRKLKVPKVNLKSQRKKRESLAEFAQGLCSMPSAFWMDATVPKGCADWVETEVLGLAEPYGNLLRGEVN